MAGTNLLRRNPHERNISALSGIAEGSGYAKPFIYGALGKEVGAAGRFDKETGRMGTAALRRQGESARLDKTMNRIVEIAKFDPQAGNDMLNRYVSSDPAFKSFEGMQFSGKTEDNKVIVTLADGQVAVLDKDTKSLIPVGPKGAPKKVSTVKGGKQTDTLYQGDKAISSTTGDRWSPGSGSGGGAGDSVQGKGKAAFAYMDKLLREPDEYGMTYQLDKETAAAATLLIDDLIKDNPTATAQRIGQLAIDQVREARQPESAAPSVDSGQQTGDGRIQAPPHPDTWLAAATKANPGASIDSLKQYYQDKYGR